jgi:type IV pilus assembly protein PilA
MNRTRKSQKGFTLVELAVVIVIIGVLAAFGVPFMLKAVERSKAAEAFNYLAAIRSAQERFIAKNGIYWGGSIDTQNNGTMTPFDEMPTTEVLDITQAPPKYFSGSPDGTLSIGVYAYGPSAPGAGDPSWFCLVYRIENSSSYGPYEISFDQNGYLPPEGHEGYRSPGSGRASSIPDEINPMGK